MPRRRKQDLIVSLTSIATVIAILLVFLLFLMAVVLLERLILG